MSKGFVKRTEFTVTDGGWDGTFRIDVKMSGSERAVSALLERLNTTNRVRVWSEENGVRNEPIFDETLPNKNAGGPPVGQVIEVMMVDMFEILSSQVAHDFGVNNEVNGVCGYCEVDHKTATSNLLDKFGPIDSTQLQ